MSTGKIIYAPTTAMSITINSLQSLNARTSASVPGSSYVDVHVQVNIATSGNATVDKAIYVYAYGTEDGTNYQYNATGNDAAITVDSTSPFRAIGVISHGNSGSQIYRSRPMAVSPAFGGYLPRNWGILLDNRTGLTLMPTSHYVSYTGYYVDVT